jgi:hypothetical protein
VSAPDFARCRSCGAEVLWVLTGNGKRMPVDVQPSEKGNLFVFTPPGIHAALVAESTSSMSARAEYARKDDRPRFVSHFATCPNAPQHRKART